MDRKRKINEKWRQKQVLYKRLKRMHELGWTTMTILISDTGAMHVHYSPDVKDHMEACIKPLADFAQQKKIRASKLKKNNLLLQTAED